MDKDLRERWMEALRSGQYHQGHGVLRWTNEDGGDAWCCLGVLLDVSGFGVWEADSSLTKGEWRYISTAGQENFIVLTDETLQQVGILTQTMDRLTVMNDRKRVSFADIATWIEEHV